MSMKLPLKLLSLIEQFRHIYFVGTFLFSVGNVIKCSCLYNSKTVMVNQIVLEIIIKYNNNLFIMNHEFVFKLMNL